MKPFTKAGCDTIDSLFAAWWTSNAAAGLDWEVHNGIVELLKKAVAVYVGEDLAEAFYEFALETNELPRWYDAMRRKAYLAADVEGDDDAPAKM